MRTTDEIVAEACSALSVERVEIRPAPDAQPQQIVRTASFAYYGNDRLDVSHGSSDPVGGWFAPSKELASAAQAAWNHSPKLGAAFMQVEFNDAYTAEMRVRYGTHPMELAGVERNHAYGALYRWVEPVPAAWDALLAMREVTLVCGCEETARCHRVLLAEILVKLGATYAGEIR